MSDINMHYERILADKLREVPEHVRVFFNAECAWLRKKNNPNFQEGYLPTLVKIVKFNRIVELYGEEHMIPVDWGM